MGSRHAAKDGPTTIKLERDDFIITTDDHEKHANLPDPLAEFDPDAVATGHEIPLPNIFSSPFKNAPPPPTADSFHSPSKALSQSDEYPLPGTNSPVKPEPLLSVSAASDVKPALASPPISTVSMPTLTPSPGKKKSSHQNALRLKAHQQAQVGGLRKLRCVCEYSHDDGFLVQCNKCHAWQHIDCFYPNASSRPVVHRCHVCVPRYVNVENAKRLQKQKMDERRAAGFQLNGHAAPVPAHSKPPVASAAVIPKSQPASGLALRMTTAQALPAASCAVSAVPGLLATSAVTHLVAPGLATVTRSLPHNVSSVTEAKVSRLSSGLTVASVVRRVTTPPTVSQLFPQPMAVAVTVPETNRPSKRKQNLQMRSTPDPMLMQTEEEIKLALMERVSARASRYKPAERNRYTEHLYRILFRLNKAGAAIKHTLLAELAKRECDTIITDENTIAVSSPSTYSVYDTVLEYRGELMTKEEYLENHDPTKEFNPYVLFYSGLASVTIVADASKYGNEARFIRRSCKPNCEVKHTFGENSRLHLVIWATQKIVPGREITIPFDFDYTQCQYEVFCPCSKKTCDVRRYGTQLRMSLKRDQDMKEEVPVKKSRPSSKAEKKEKPVKSEPALRPVECKVKLERLDLDSVRPPASDLGSSSASSSLVPAIARVRSEAVESPVKKSCALPFGLSRLRNDAEARANLTARLQERLSPSKGSPGGLTSKGNPASPLRAPPTYSRSPAKSASPAFSRSPACSLISPSKGPMVARRRSRKQQLVALRNPFSEEQNASSEEEDSQGPSFWKT